MSELATEDSEIGAPPLDFGTLRVCVCIADPTKSRSPIE